MMARSYSSPAEKYRAHRRAFRLGQRLGVTPAEAQSVIDRSEARKRWKETTARLRAKIDGTPREAAMHPEDWQDIRLTRTADGIYIFGSPMEAGPDRLWGLPVVQNDAKAAGTGMVGSFQPAWITLFERRGVDIQVGYVGSQFGEGKRTVRADMRAALAVFRPAAFCSVTGI